MTYRDDVEALAARKAALDQELAAKTRERDDAARLLADARERSRLPILPNLRIASPCKASWDDMTGDDRVRHCAKCDKDVFNISALTREQAESLILEKNGDLCARYYQRKDGTILLADCEVGRKRKQRFRIVAAGMAITITAGTAAAITLHRGEDKEKPMVMQGGIADMTTTYQPPVTSPQPVTSSPAQPATPHDYAPQRGGRGNANSND